MKRSVFSVKTNSVYLMELRNPRQRKLEGGRAEVEYPGWLVRLLTHPVRSFENYSDLFQKIITSRGAIKV